ncbi:hypothetical protein E2C01_086514 [Portunus trituberculatus]|uniref:Uncharacterized protein n=1 Tax=Portunus trituberculatus TaxID=210409 RepID=A0A5B7JGJ6_PORTR|nr:hypothetical protein [Portunus trituberculatus]
MLDWINDEMWTEVEAWMAKQKGRKREFIREAHQTGSRKESVWRTVVGAGSVRRETGQSNEDEWVRAEKQEGGE